MTDKNDDALAPLGWDARVRERWAELTAANPPLAALAPGRVVRSSRHWCTVATAAGERRATAAVPAAVGDWAAVDVRDGDVVVRGVIERWSALTRRDPLGDRVQVLAANVDVVLVTAPADRPSPARVEREVAIAADGGARPVVVVTKVDLDPAYADVLRRRLAGVDLDVVATSVPTGAGVDDVRRILQPHRTAVLLGPSGAGKSSLANALLGEDRLATAAVRDLDARGRHTTTSRELVVVPTGGVLVDTPGLRSLGLVGDGHGLATAFADIHALAADCRFADCRHEEEPGCAVRAAVERGDLDADRLASHRKLEAELAHLGDPAPASTRRRRRR